MSQIKLTLSGQTLSIQQPVIAGDSVNYLTAQIVGKSADWNGLTLWLAITSSSGSYVVEFENDVAGQYLDLAAGTYSISVYGEETADGNTLKRVTSTEVMLRVQNSGVLNGEPLPVTPPSVGEQILAVAQNALSVANGVRADADAGEFDGAAGTNGADAPEMQIQYSVDGAAAWHDTPTDADFYMRQSTDGGKTWGSAALYRGEKGEKGDTGDSLEFTWDGTSLGIRVEGDTEYQYVNLKGDKGDTGAKGDTGEKGDTGNGIASVTLKSGDHSPGTTDVYTITFIDGTSTDFPVYNGANGELLIEDIVNDLAADIEVPLADGDVAAIGISSKFARADHVHPRENLFLIDSITSSKYEISVENGRLRYEEV